MLMNQRKKWIIKNHVPNKPLSEILVGFHGTEWTKHTYDYRLEQNIIKNYTANACNAESTKNIGTIILLSIIIN